MAAEFFLRGEFRRARIGRRLDDLRFRQMVLHPAAALRQRLRMRVKFPDLAALEPADEAMLDRQNDLRHDLQFAVHEHVQRVRDDALRGIFHRYHAVVRAVLGHFGKNVGDGFLCRVTQARAEFPDGRLVRESRFRPEVGDGHGFFQRQRAGHDFAINRPQRFLGDGPVVQLANTVKHRALAMRRINFLTRRKLDVADAEHVLRALVQQPHDLRVELINRFAMLGYVHGSNWQAN